MEKLLNHRVALITGAARGIGRAIALRLAQEGCDIAFTDIAIDAMALATKQAVEQQGVRCLALAGDASDFDSAHQIVDEVVRSFGRLDILVNNAGITRDGLLLRMTEQQWDSVLSVNLKSAFNFVQAVTPVMLKQHSGSIISMSSVVGLNGNAGQANYAASKAGIIALMKSVAKELGGRGIRANAIAPGFILTEMTSQLSPEILQQYTSKIPMKRGGSPEEVAEVALFLASDMSSYVSGQVIQVNGAMA